MRRGRHGVLARRAAAALALMLGLGVVPSALALDREPRVGYAYPAGARRGTAVEVTLGGQWLFDADRVLVSGEGVAATVLEQERPLTPKEQTSLRETLAAIQDKRKKGIPLTPDEAKRVPEIQKALASFARRMANPSLGEAVTLRVVLAATAALGRREIRLVTSRGLSNPVAFEVGDLPEVSKAPWRSPPTPRGSAGPEAAPGPIEATVTLPVTANAQMPPGAVHRYRFTASAGQRLVASVRARDLIPYIADAVPGWFQATATLTDAQGREVAYDDDDRFRPDPLLLFRVPAAGEYVLEVHDALYRGREDFVYRLTIGELPYVTDLFPLGGRIGSSATAALEGWSLPRPRAALPLTGQSPGIHPLPLDGSTDAVEFAADTLPEVLEKEPNDDDGAAQPLSLPVIVNGRIDAPGDADVFRFTGTAGQVVVAEVTARRLGSPLDSLLVLADPTGREVARNDDHEDPAFGLETHHADSYLLTTLPAAGTYRLRLTDAQRAGGPAYAYRLRVSAPRPDFELRVTPSSVSLRGGTSAPLSVRAIRRDGFAGEIALALTDAPPGLSLQGGRIPEKQDVARVTLSAPPTTGMEPFALRIAGRATIDRRAVVREAVAADDRVQAFAYHHLVPATSLEVLVLPGLPAFAAAKVVTATPVRIPRGGAASVEVRIPRMPRFGEVAFELSEPPDGITLDGDKPLSDGREIVLRADAGRVAVGAKGNLIVRVYVERKSGEGAPVPAAARRVQVGSLPAIPFEVVAAP